MTALAVGHYRWGGGEVLPGLPWEPEPEPGYEPPVVPVQPGRQGDRWMVRVAEFPSGRDRGVLWDARVETMAERLREMGPNHVVVSVPATPTAMRILGDQIGSTGVYHLRNMVARELIIGSTDTGRARWRLVVRDQVSVRGGRIEIPAVGIVGGLTGDRVIGAPTRLNLVGLRGRFGPMLAGWRHVGPGSSGIEAGGVDGSGFAAWVTGTPGRSYIEARVRWTLGEQPWRARQWFGAQAYVKIPTGEDLEGYGLVSLGVVDRATGKVWWPYDGDSEMGRVDASTPEGQWISDGPVTARGLLPRPPYAVDLCIRLHATHPTKKTYYDDARIVRPENTSTSVERDLIAHPAALFGHAQQGRDKSSWGVSVVYGEPSGTVELGRWEHEDGQSMDEALEAVCGRGVEVWDQPGPGRAVRSAKRRGAVRQDLMLNPWDVLGEVQWSIDPGAQKSAARGTSAASSLWGGSDEGAIDTSQSRGQIIDVVLSGPVGMLPSQLVQWLRGQLSSLALLPATTTVLVSESWARRVAVGDSLRVRLRSDAAGHVDWMRVAQMVHMPGRGLCAVDLGTDPERGGRS